MLNMLSNYVTNTQMAPGDYLEIMVLWDYMPALANDPLRPYLGGVKVWCIQTILPAVYTEDWKAVNKL
jgi:hypothetical protein